MKFVAAGANIQDIKRGIENATTAVVTELQKSSKAIVDLEQIAQVAKCSANQDKQIGDIIAEAMDKVGKDGVVTIEEGRSIETLINVVDGMQYTRGYISPYFATNPENQRCEYDEPLILITDYHISSLKSIMSTLERVAKSGKPFVIIADEVDGEALATLVINKVRGTVKVVAIKAPSFGDRRKDILEDLAIATGGKFISREAGMTLESVTMDQLGKCQKISVTQDTTTVIGGSGIKDAVDQRIALVKRQLENVASDFDKEKLQERLAKLSGGVAQIVVGGFTEVEMREKKDRVDDALRACKAATEEGILPGGGISVLYARNVVGPALRAAAANEDEKAGIDILFRALEAPLRQIAKNTGVDDGVIVSKVVESKSSSFGYNAANKQYGDMFEFGIVVPTKVERTALQNAASVAALLLTTDCMISTIPETAPAPQQGGPFM
jgi:chaperonin GroEL